MKKYFYITVIALLSTMILEAQNVNQTIQVTNDYRSAMPELNKKTLDLKVSDTLLLFDYKFDYSVFDTPYRGSYEFSPYAMALDHRRVEPYYNKLYLRFGAGYGFHPELDLDYQLYSSDDLNIGLFADGSGYYGCYRLYDQSLAPTRFFADGFDFSDALGLSGKWTTYNNILRFELGQKGIYAADRIAGSAYNAFYLNTSLSSIKDLSSFFFYDLSLAYRYGFDNIYYSAANKLLLGEHNILLSGSAGPVLNENYRFLADFHVEYNNIPSISSSSTLVKITPHLEFELGPASISAGARFFFDSQKTFSVAPDLRASASFFSNKLEAGLYLTGDARLNTHHSLKGLNHFYIHSPDSSQRFAGVVSRERLDAGLKLKGNLNNFKLGLNAGWALVQSDMMSSFVINAQRPQDCFATADYQLLKADFAAEYFSEKLSAGLNLHLRHSYKYGNQSALVFAPSLLSGDISLKYKYNSRISAALMIEASTARRSVVLNADEQILQIPAWVCPTISADYKLSDKWTIWAKAGNLVGSSPRYDLTHVQAGPYLTIGAAFIF